MATTPVLAGYTLPQVAAKNGFKYSLEYWGGMQQMADGSVAVDLVNDNVKRRFELTWKNITSAQRDTVVSAFHAIRKSSANLTAPDGQTATVTRSPQQQSLDWDPEIKGDGSILWSGTLRLVEA